MKKQLNLKTAELMWAELPRDETRVGNSFGFRFIDIPFSLWVDVYGTFEEENINYFPDEDCEDFISAAKKIEFFENYLENAYNGEIEFEIAKEDGKYFIEYEEN